MSKRESIQGALKKPKRKIQPSPVVGKVSRNKLRSTVEAIHVAPIEGNKWVVQKAGPKRVRKVFPTPSAALGYVKRLELNQNPRSNPGLVFHGRDGRVIRGNKAKLEMARVD